MSQALSLGESVILVRQSLIHTVLEYRGRLQTRLGTYGAYSKKTCVRRRQHVRVAKRQLAPAIPGASTYSSQPPANVSDQDQILQPGSYGDQHGGYGHQQEAILEPGLPAALALPEPSAPPPTDLDHI
eukprot:g72300.t1